MTLFRGSAEVDHRATIGEAVCPYCGVGCRLWGEAAYGEVLRIKGADAPANRGGICAKGATLPQVLHASDRLLHPRLRAHRSGEPRATSWDTAIGQAAERLKRIVERHGPDAVAFYGSGQLDTEALYLAVKLFKGWIGTNNTDSNSRLCMASAVAAYVGSFGSDGPPTCFDDIDHADLILIAGSNMAEAHPVTFDRIKERRAGTKPPLLVVIDPRRTRTAEQADLHVPIAPGTDVFLFHLLAKRLLETNRVDHGFIERHTEGLTELAAHLKGIDESSLLAPLGVPGEMVDRLVDRLAKARGFLSFFCMGLGQSIAGVAKHQALFNLHLLLGQIGKPGAGPFSLTGQPNAMGGREGGLLSHQLPGYRQVQDADQRREVEAYWRLPSGSISPTPGYTAVEMFRALERGRLKAIWIAASNPLASLPDLHQVRRGLMKAELVIVQDIHHPTETSRYADILFPAANWGEKEWTSTNSERMVSFSERLLPPAGESRPDWEIVAAVARRLGAEGFDYRNREQVWDEFIGLTAGRPCDMSGAKAERLRRCTSLQWPCPSPDHPGTQRRYLDGRFATPSGRARLVVHDPRPPMEPVDHEFPYVLTTGRLYAHWHTLTRTGKSAKLLKRDPDPYVEIHPADAARLGLVHGTRARIQSRRGTIHLPVRLTESVRPGLLFAPFHWGDHWGIDRAVNYLTIAATDPVSKQPELKYCAVTIEAVPEAAPEVLAAPQEAPRSLLRRLWNGSHR